MHAQDPAERNALDEAREDARLRELATQAATQEERERQWRVARGTATAEDLKGPIRVGPAQRDTWMTVLPEERRPDPTPSQVNVVRPCRLPWQNAPPVICLHGRSVDEFAPAPCNVFFLPKDTFVRTML